MVCILVSKERSYCGEVHLRDVVLTSAPFPAASGPIALSRHPTKEEYAEWTAVGYVDPAIIPTLPPSRDSTRFCAGHWRWTLGTAEPHWALAQWIGRTPWAGPRSPIWLPTAVRPRTGSWRPIRL